MKTLEYTVRFVTPAFLGNAEQSGQWRTPPFKALIRQWWRVAHAADNKFNVNVVQMRREEGLLFGHAWLEDDRDEQGRKVSARKSLVRIRLNRWDQGNLKAWAADTAVAHPEVPRPVGSQLYLGYGPLVFRQGTTLKANAAIQAGDAAMLSIGFPVTHWDAKFKRLLETNSPRIERALALVHLYGTLGGRSRNGWGSFVLEPVNDESKAALGLSQFPMRPWREALAVDWPHAIGRDDAGPLAWQTSKPYGDWKALMRDLAIIKIGLRTQFTFPSARPPHSSVEARHWLSYPITTHTTRVWKHGARLPNSLRFKVRTDGNDANKLRGLIFHVPCLPPSEFKPDRAAIERTWKMVHALLDHMCMASGRTYPMIADNTRRSALKSHLDDVSLQRVPG